MLCTMVHAHNQNSVSHPNQIVQSSKAIISSTTTPIPDAEILGRGCLGPPRHCWWDIRLFVF